MCSLVPTNYITHFNILFVNETKVFNRVLLYYLQEEMFIALLLRAMKNDINIKRVAAFAKRLLQVRIEF